MKLHIHSSHGHSVDIDTSKIPVNVTTGDEVRIMTGKGKYYLKITLVEYRIDCRTKFKTDGTRVHAKIAVNRVGTKEEVHYLADTLAKQAKP